MASNIKEPEKKDEYSEAFRVFDREHDDTCSAEELTNVIQQLGSDNAAEVIAVLQSFSHDGVINYMDMIQKITTDNE